MNRRLAAASLASTLLTLVVVPAGQATQHPPTLLWKTYPLVPRSSPTRAPLLPPAAQPPVGVTRAAAGRAVTGDANRFSLELFTLVLAALGSATALALVMRRSLALRGATWPSEWERRGKTAAVTLPTAPEDDPAQLDAEPPDTEPPDTEPLETFRFGRPLLVEQPHVEAAAGPGRRPTESGRPTARRAEIKLWRGYVKSQLYAVCDGEAVAASPYFRLGNGGQPSRDAELALAWLLEELERDGWTVWILASKDAAWYERGLTRMPNSPHDFG